MNFAGPFDTKALSDSPVVLDGEGFSFGAKPGFVQHHPSDTHVVVPDAHLLFSGNYVRIGSDLIISNADQKFVVGNYFKGEVRPALSTVDGATLSGQIVDALTGHVHFAQAGAPAAGQVIGHVLKMSGGATAIRNGVSIDLHVGDPVQKGDVIQTGSDSSIGMTFVDGSAFGMTSNARMVLNEMIYDPNGSSNSSLISLVQGTVTFVAGQTAKNGNMRVETPVATMGIRGTAVLVEIAANDGPTKFSVLVEPDGHTGSFNLYDKTSGQLIGTVSQAGQVTLVSSLGIGQPPTAIEQLKTLQEQEQAKGIINQVFQLYFPNYNPDNSNPKTQKFGSSSVNPLADLTFGQMLFAQLTAPQPIPQSIFVVDPLTGNIVFNGRIFYNTKAVFSASTVSAEQSFVTSVKSFKISDVVHIDDPDIGNAPFYDTAVPFVAGSAIIKSAVSTNPNLDANFLSQFLHINQNTGEVWFDRLAFNFLAEGESVTFMLEVTSRSGPDTAQVVIPITITGDNDVPNDNGVPNGAPTIVYPLSDIVGAVKEDTPAGVPSLATNGTITFRDVDLTDTHTAAQEFTSSSSTLPGFTAGQHLGTFTIDLDPENTTDIINTGTVQWHFSLPDDDPVLQSLAEGQTITQVYTVTIQDIHGAFVTQTITITITGTNDAPVLAADASVHQALEVPDTTGAPDAVVDVASGTLAFTDVDLSDTHQASAHLHTGASSVVWSGGSYSDIPSETRDALDGAVTAVVSENNTDTSSQGAVNWEFKLPDRLFDFLAKGETLTLIYDVTVTDNNGVSSTQQITVQIGAANDQPVITVINASAAVKEDVDPVGSLLKDTGTVTFTDADLSDTHTAHVVYNDDATGAVVSPALALALATALTVPASALAAGDHDFNWNFALDTSLLQYLAEGETITATYTITVRDSSDGTNDTSSGQTVTVTITGTNDAPTITVTNPAAVNEGDTGTPAAETVVVADHVSIVDVDTSDARVPYVGNTLAFESSTGPSPSSGVLANLFTLNETDGTISYDRAAFDYLAGGEHVTATFTFDVSSGPDTVQKSITVTIDGVNDAPVVAVTNPVADTEGDAGPPDVAVVTVADHVSISDVDASDVRTPYAGALAFDAAHSSGPAPAGGALADLFTLDTVTGQISYDRAAFDYLAGGEHVTATFTFDVSSGPDTVQKSITVTIGGVNDAPVVAVTNPVADTEGNAGTPDLAVVTVADHVSISDVDASDVHVPYAGALAFDAAHSSGPAPAGGALADLFTLDTVTGQISYDRAAFDYLGGGEHVTATFTFDVSSGPDTVQKSISLTIDGVNDAPVLNGDNVSILSIGNGSPGLPYGTTKVLGITVSDVDAGADTFTVTATADHGTLATVAGGQPLATGVSGSFADISDLFSGGAVYTPDNTALTDKVTLTVSDGHGGSDSLNFIFKQVAPGGVALLGTTGKDIIFSSSGDDTMTGLAGQDNFVFSPASGHDTITDFTVGTDKIDFKALAGMDVSALTTMLDTADHVSGDTLLHINGTTDTLLVKGVAALSVSDFILHA